MKLVNGVNKFSAPKTKTGRPKPKKAKKQLVDGQYLRHLKHAQLVCIYF